MNHAMKLTTCAILILMMFASSALAASLTIGSYSTVHEGTEMVILLNKDGSGFFEGETQNSLEWKQNGSELTFKIYGEEGSSEFMNYKGKVLSPESFDFDGLEYTLIKN